MGATIQQRITIDPVTRLEGHGRIEVFLKPDGAVDRAFFQVPELRGFEKFVEGRPAEDMPQITSRICGVCPTAHHMAAVKALDRLFGVEPPPAARKIRELVYSAFFIEDHALHFYYLGGPDFIVGPKAPKAARNILGVIEKVGAETALKVIALRRRLREIIGIAGGKAIHPVLGLPGGVARRIHPDEQERFVEIAAEAVAFSQFSLQAFHEMVLQNAEYLHLICSQEYTHQTYYMGLVDLDGGLNFYDGHVRVVRPDGSEYVTFAPDQYLDYIAEHVEPWSYVKFCYLKPLGWKGFVDGAESGVYCVAPLARLNACGHVPTPLAKRAYEEYFATLGGKPVHHTLANHWARLIEMLYAAERLKELAADPELTSRDIRNLPEKVAGVGIAVVEAPRGTLIHHYEADEKGLIRKANLIVATQNNSARIALSVDRAAKAMVRGPEASEEMLNMVEMAFRAYDPCYGCASHALRGAYPIEVRFYGAQQKLTGITRRCGDGTVERRFLKTAEEVNV